MWLLKFLPDWIFYAMLFNGVVGMILCKFVPAYYRTAAFAGFASFFVIGVFMAGAIHDNAAWEARVKEMESKIAAAAVESEKENVKVVEKIVYKNQIVKQRGEDIIKFVDREIVKYDNQCVIPKEFVEAHNKAARGVK